MKDKIGKKFGKELISNLNRAAKLKVRCDLKGINFMNELTDGIEALGEEDLITLTRTLDILGNIMDGIEATKL